MNLVTIEDKLADIELFRELGLALKQCINDLELLLDRVKYPVSVKCEDKMYLS